MMGVDESRLESAESGRQRQIEANLAGRLKRAVSRPGKARSGRRRGVSADRNYKPAFRGSWDVGRSRIERLACDRYCQRAVDGACHP